MENEPEQAHYKRLYEKALEEVKHLHHVRKIQAKLLIQYQKQIKALGGKIGKIELYETEHW